MSPAKIRILLVDDQEVVLTGLRMRLTLEEDLQVIGEARDGLGALKIIREQQPDFVIMDIEMPNMDGIEAAKAIRELAPEVRVIVLSLYDDPRLRARAQEAGARAYVEKRDGAAHLVQEIRRVFEEGKRSASG